MRIVEVYSHLNGLEYIKVHCPEIWEEIESVINKVDAEKCKVKVSQEKTKMGKMLYSPVEMNALFKAKLEKRNWCEARTSYYVTSDADLASETLALEPKKQKEIIEAAGKKALRTYNQTDFVKNKVAIEVQFGKYAFVAYDLFVKHMAFYIGKKINVGIEILPMKELSSQMSSGVSYYECEVYNVLRQGRNTPAVPLVIIGIAP